MHDEHPHPFLAQVPLTVSPFLSLPTSIPLPYSYKTLPSTLPASILQQPSTTNDSIQKQQQPAYVQSASGTSATPDAILTSCLALQQHLQKLESDARKTLQEWEDRRKAEDLAEKRRLAPGWLDSGVHIIKPEEDMQMDTTQAPAVDDLMDDDPQKRQQERAGEELDRVFGVLKV